MIGFVMASTSKLKTGGRGRLKEGAGGDGRREKQEGVSSNQNFPDEDSAPEGGGSVPEDCICVLICSASGAGKSHLVERLCENDPVMSQRPVFVYCNNKTFDTPNGASEYAASLLPRAQPITLEDALRRVNHATLIIEDIQNFNSREMELLKGLVNFCRRHRHVHLFLISQVLYTTGLVSVVGVFDAVVVLKHGGNDKTFEAVARERRMDKKEASVMYQNLMDAPRFSMVVFTNRHGKRMTLLESREAPTLQYLMSGDVEEDASTLARRRGRLEDSAIEDMLNSFTNVRAAKALFRFVKSRTANKNVIDESDYSVHMRNSKNRVLRCSLFDYIGCCLGELEPTPAVKVLHVFLCKKIILPERLVCSKMRKLVPPKRSAKK